MRLANWHPESPALPARDSPDAWLLGLLLEVREPDATSVHLHAESPTLPPHLLGCLDQVIRRDVVTPVEGRLASQDVRLADLGERETVHRRRCFGRCRTVQPSGAQTHQVGDVYKRQGWDRRPRGDA